MFRFARSHFRKKMDEADYAAAQEDKRTGCCQNLRHRRCFWPVLIMFFLLVGGAIPLLLYLVDRYKSIDVKNAEELVGADTFAISQNALIQRYNTLSRASSVVQVEETFYADGNSLYKIVFPTFIHPCPDEEVTLTFTSSKEDIVVSTTDPNASSFISGINATTTSSWLVVDGVTLSCDGVEIDSATVESTVDVASRFVHRGFGNGNRDYDVDGQFDLVEISELNNGETTLRHFILFTDMVVSPGPDVYLYLSTIKNARDLSDDDVLVPIDGTERGTFSKAGTYVQELENSLTSTADSYMTVVVWCRRFSVLFGYADFE